MVTLWGSFTLLAIIVYIAGGRLSYYGDVLGEKWGVERTFIGLILLSTITSLPELGTSLFSIILVDSPDLALGNVLGSNLFNIFIIPILALLFREVYLYRVNREHAGTGDIVMVIYTLIGTALSLRMFGWDIPNVLNMSPFSIAIGAIAAIGIYLVFRDQKTSEKSIDEVELYSDLRENRATLVFAVSALVVVGAGAGLAWVGKILAIETGLGETFFGTLFFAFVTSLPEIVVSWGALKQLGAVNLAMGNIMGSCLFNVGIIFIFDIASVSGPVFTAASPSHLISVFGGIAMIAIAGFAIHLRNQRKASLFFSPEMVFLTATYLSTMYLLFISS